MPFDPLASTMVRIDDHRDGICVQSSLLDTTIRAAWRSCRREDPGEPGGVGHGREVEVAEAAPAAQLLQIDRTGAGVPGGKVDPALGLLGRFVEVHAPAGVLGAGTANAFLALREIILITETPKFGLARTPAISSSVEDPPKRAATEAH
jgi:hypothetical protein